MELISNITTIAKNLSAKFPDLEKFYLYIHILGYISGLDKPYFHFHADIAPIVSLFNFNKDILKSIEDSLSFSIERLSENERKDLCKRLLEICLQFERTVDELSVNNIEFLEDLLSSEPEAISKNNGWYSVNFSALSAKSQKKYIDWEIEKYFYWKTPSVPQYLTEKVAALAKPKDGQTIYDPNCNTGSIFVGFFEKFPDLNFNFKGVVRNQYEWLLCIVNLYVSGLLDDKRVEVEIEVVSPFEDVPQKYHEMKGGDTYLGEEFADIAVSIAPVEEKFSEDELDSRFFGLSYSLKEPGYSYIELMLNAVNDKGKAIIVVPDSVLSSSEGRFFREAYLSRDWVEEVFSLPESIFKKSASVIVLNKLKENQGSITFANEKFKLPIETSLVKSQNNADLRVASNGVTIEKTLDLMVEVFSSAFPELEEFKYLYILAAFTQQMNYDFLETGCVGVISDFIYCVPSYHEMFGTFNTVFYSKDQYKKAIEYLIPKVVESAKHIQFTHKDQKEVIEDLAKTEPDAVQIRQSYLTNKTSPQVDKLDYFKLSDSGISEFTKLEIEKALENPHYLSPSSYLEGIIVELAEPKPNQIVYQLNCGVGSLFVEFEKQYSDYKLKYHGWVDDKFSELLCNANLSRISGISEIYNFNPLAKNFSWDEDLSEWKEDNQSEILFYDGNDFLEFRNLVDIAVGITAFKMRVFQGEFTITNPPLIKDGIRYEYALIEEMIATLNETGKAIVVVPDSFLFSVHGKSFRQKYLSLDLIERVISLPNTIFNPFSSIKTSIIVFNKSKANKNVVVFDGKDDRFEETQVKTDEIISQNNGELSPSLYALKERKVLKTIFDQSEYPTEKLKKVVEFVRSGRNYSPKDRITKDSLRILPYVRVSDLAKNEFAFDLDISNIKRTISTEKVHKNTIIDFSTVLISKIAPKLKPTYFKFTDQPIVIGSDVIAIKLKGNVNVEYFLAQLNSRHVQIQVEMMSSGVTIQRITKEDFLNIQIILPPLEEQTKQAIEFLKETQKEIVEDIAEVEEKIQQTEYDVIATISHNLSQKLGKIGDDYNTLIRRLKRGELKSAQKFNELFGDKEAFDKVVNRLNQNIEDANETMATTTRFLQKNKISVESVNILQFLRNEIVNSYSRSSFEISIETKLKSLIVPIDKDALKDAIRNLIENAQKHGFKSVERKFHIVFEISKQTDSDGIEYASILYKNDGESFPKGFSFNEFKRLGGRAGETKGTGLGGFWINKVVGLHKGKFDYIPVDTDSLSPYKVMFEVLLPLEQ